MADQAPDSVWQQLHEAGEAERHFNQLQAGYRGLASTWLLAAFVGVGFTFINNSTIPFHLWLPLAGGIAVLGAIGIALVWVIDILVYHQLLNGVFFTAMRLESAHYPPELRFRSNMVHLSGRGGVVGHVMLFYMGAMSALLVVATGAGCAWAITAQWPGSVVASAATACILILVAANVGIWRGTQACRRRTWDFFEDVVRAG
jgi:hypothetical protein